MNDLLLVIDMQNVYLPDQPWACETVAHTKANILKLLEKHPKKSDYFYPLYCRRTPGWNLENL
mgnify:CR=1 FL=1